MIFDNILQARHSDVLDDLLRRCLEVKGSINTSSIRELAKESARATSTGSKLPDRLNVLLERWYNSLSTANPDYTVYGEDVYIAELWACWKVYSRIHLLNIQKDKCLPTGSITDVHRDAAKIVDLGCGFAYTTAAVKQIFPNAKVYGTNIDGTLQMDVAQTMAKDYGFTMAGDPQQIAGLTDLIFASEYFEHLDRPLKHLDTVLEALQPKALLVANAFGPMAIGHFNEYYIYENTDFPPVAAKKTGQMFNSRMKHHGYSAVKTKLWNNRPAYWVKQ